MDTPEFFDDKVLDNQSDTDGGQNNDDHDEQPHSLYWLFMKLLVAVMM
jgi:hypothetical protein